MPLVPAASDTGDPLLLTPGPLSTSRSVKEAMVHDWGSRDARFLRVNKAVLDGLPRVIHGADAFVTVPMQGSGTFAVEAMLTTFVPKNGKVLVLINGAYGHRAKRILDIAGSKTVVHETPEDTPPDRGGRAHPQAPDEHQPRFRGLLRDDERHPEPDRGDRRDRGPARQAPPR